MKPPLRSKQEVIINAPLKTVWERGMDLERIPAFHPRGVKVELLSGKARREPGVSYRCYLSDGKHTCVEKDIEIVPMQKIVTVLPEDTLGISKVLPDYVVEQARRMGSEGLERAVIGTLAGFGDGVRCSKSFSFVCVVS